MAARRTGAPHKPTDENQSTIPCIVPHHIHVARSKTNSTCLQCWNVTSDADLCKNCTTKLEQNVGLTLLEAPRGHITFNEGPYYQSNT